MKKEGSCALNFGAWLRLRRAPWDGGWGDAWARGWVATGKVIERLRVGIEEVESRKKEREAFTKALSLD